MKTIQMLWIVLVIVCLSGSVNAEQLLTIGLLDALPLAYRDSDKNITGVLSEITDQMIQRTGLHLQKTLMPYARIANSLAVGDLDLAFGQNVNLPSDIEGIARAYDVRCLILHRNDTNIQTYDDLYKLNGEVGVMRGSFFFQRLREDPAIKKHEITSYEQGIQMLATNRINALAITDIGAFALIPKYHFEEIIAFPGFVYETSDVSLFISKKSVYYKSSVQSALKSVVDALREEGVIQQITDKYVGKGWNK